MNTEMNTAQLIADFKQIAGMARECPIRPQVLRDAIALANHARVLAGAGNLVKSRYMLDIALERVGLDRAPE